MLKEPKFNVLFRRKLFNYKDYARGFCNPSRLIAKKKTPAVKTTILVMRAMANLLILLIYNPFDGYAILADVL